MSQKTIDKATKIKDSGRTKEAMEILAPLTKSKDYQVAVNATISLGICYSNEENYEKAMDLYQKAINICENHEWLARIGSIYRDMAIVAKGAKKYQEAEKLFRKSLEYQEKHYDEGQGLNASLGITHSKLGTLYILTKDFKKAKQEFEVARELLRKGDHEYWSLMTEVDYAGFLVTQKLYQEAKEIVQRAIPNSIRQEKEYFLIKSWIVAGDCEKGLKNKDGAEMFYSMAKITVNKIFDSKEVRERFLEEIEKRLKSVRASTSNAKSLCFSSMSMLA